jgi:hypothetical protein
MWVELYSCGVTSYFQKKTDSHIQYTNIFGLITAKSDLHVPCALFRQTNKLKLVLE